ncbi:hypothetical protein X975_15298, partial [Stegodyphus mimosarum]
MLAKKQNIRLPFTVLFAFQSCVPCGLICHLRKIN